VQVISIDGEPFPTIASRRESSVSLSGVYHELRIVYEFQLRPGQLRKEGDGHVDTRDPDPLARKKGAPVSFHTCQTCRERKLWNRSNRQGKSCIAMWLIQLRTQKTCARKEDSGSERMLTATAHILVYSAADVGSWSIEDRD
jgi:hypothetical protein